MPGKRWLNRGIVSKGVFFAFFSYPLSEISCAFSSEKTGLRDIKGPVPWPFDFFLIVAAGLAFLLLVTGAFFYFIARRKTDLRPPSSLPHEAAYEALEALERRDLIRQGRIQEYYEELSNIIRRYLESRFSYRASQMTKEECLLTIQTEKALSPEQRTLLRDFLHDCDIVKFAGYKPQPEKLESSLQTSRKIVDVTKEEPSLR